MTTNRVDYNRAWRAANLDKVRAYAKRSRVKNADRCRIYNQGYYLRNSEMWILTNIRTRAKVKGIPCTIIAADIKVPEVCPVLGIRLERNRLGRQAGPRPNSPAVDRIRPELGYVPGNVLVVSHLANCIKQNATPAQIRAVADFYAQLLGGSNA